MSQIHYPCHPLSHYRHLFQVNTYVEGDTNVVTTVQGGSTNVVSVFGLAATPTTDFSYQAASISATGHLQQGAGTTIYKNIGAIPATGCPKYLSGTAVFNDEYIVSYKNKITGQASVHVMTVNENRETTVLSTAFQNVDMYDIVTLNKGTGLFVSISQDDTWPVSSNSEVIIAGKVGPAPDYVITFGASTHYGLPSTSSIDPAITALSNTTFAIAYFSPVAQGQSALRCWTRFGTY